MDIISFIKIVYIKNMVHHVVSSNIYKLNFLYSPKCACTLTRQLWYACHAEDMIPETPTYQWHNINSDFPTPNSEYV